MKEKTNSLTSLELISADVKLKNELNFAKMDVKFKWEGGMDYSNKSCNFLAFDNLTKTSPSRSYESDNMAYYPSDHCYYSSSSVRHSDSPAVLKLKIYIKTAKDMTDMSNILETNILFPDFDITVKPTYLDGKVTIKWNSGKLMDRCLLVQMDIIEISNSTDTPINEKENSAYYASGILSVKNDKFSTHNLRVRVRLVYTDVNLEVLSKDNCKTTDWLEYKVITSTPVIKQVKCDRKNNDVDVEIEWITPDEARNLNSRIYVQTANETKTQEVVAGATSTVFKNLNLSGEKTYMVFVEYYHEETSGPKSEQVILIHTTPKDFNIEFIENPLSPESSYSLYANWENGSLSEGEYVEFEYTNNQNKTEIKPLGPDAKPPLQVNDTAIIEAKIRKRTTKSIGPWSKEISVPFIGTSQYDFDHSGRLLKIDVLVTAIDTQTNKFEYDDRGNILSKEISQHKN